MQRTRDIRDLETRTMKATALTTEGMTALAGHHPHPCLSLFLPTDRHHPETQQDPIRFRGLVHKLEYLLQPTHSTDLVNSLPEPKVARGDDLLDDVGECAPKRGGRVIVVPSERMPATTGVAAIMRF
jgi:hypothetical protein